MPDEILNNIPAPGRRCLIDLSETEVNFLFGLLDDTRQNLAGAPGESVVLMKQILGSIIKKLPVKTEDIVSMN